MLLSFVLLILNSAGQLSAIQLPQPGNQANVATGTTNLMITATVTTSPTACSWSGTGLTSIDIYISGFGCETVTPTATHNITCTNIPGGFSTSLTYLTAMTSNTSVSLSCDSAVVYSLSMIVKDCPSPTSNNVPVNPSSGVYNTQANFQCSHGSTLFYVNGTTGNTATKCLATAEWENEKIVQCLTTEQLSAIQLPQPGNQANVATGTTNLMITAKVTTSPTACTWQGTGLTATQFYASGFGGCQTVTPTATHSITCTNVPGGFSTSLTYLTAMTSNTNVSLDCDSAVVYSLFMIVKECSSPTPNNVPVNPSSGVYNTQANFQCFHGSTLFYVNGTTGNTATKCLATAEWENEKIVQCWSAPTATLIGNNTICAGNIVTFQCTASGGFPSLDRVEIYFNQQKQTLVGNTWTSNSLSSSNNGDIVECRAINSYTAMQEYTNLGRDSKTLIVHYAAEGFAVNDGTTSHSNICTWYIAPPGPRSCTITFSLNPTTYTTTLTKDGAIVMNDATNQPQTSTLQSFVFTRNQPSFNDSGNYTLRINNGIFENTFTFNISVINEVQPTPPPTIPPPDNLGVIIGAAVGGVVAFILIIILVVYCLRQQNNKKHKDKEVTGRSNIGMEAEHGYYEVADRSPYQNEQNIPATQSTNYENLKDNVNVTRDEQGYVDIQGVGPSVVTTPNDGYEVFIKRNDTAGNQQNESQYEHFG